MIPSSQIQLYRYRVRTYHTCSEPQYPTPRHPSSPSGLRYNSIDTGSEPTISAANYSYYNSTNFYQFTEYNSADSDIGSERTIPYL